MVSHHYSVSTSVIKLTSQLPGLIEQHSMIDTPSHVLFPWLHGICDDGAKGRDMAAFFG